MYTRGLMRALRLLGLALLLFAAAGPVLEALSPCGQECLGDEPAGGCSLELCCSCCVHFRIDPPSACDLPRGLPSLERVVAPGAGPASTADPREIPHVPKTLA
jgi:hypothetical protein